MDMEYIGMEWNGVKWIFPVLDTVCNGIVIAKAPWQVLEFFTLKSRMNDTTGINNAAINMTSWNTLINLSQQHKDSLAYQSVHSRLEIVDNCIYLGIWYFF